MTALCMLRCGWLTGHAGSPRTRKSRKIELSRGGSGSSGNERNAASNGASHDEMTRGSNRNHDRLRRFGGVTAARLISYAFISLHRCEDPALVCEVAHPGKANWFRRADPRDAA